MLFGGDGISNDAITLGACFCMFFNVCLHSRSFLLHTDWRKSDSSVDMEPQVNWRPNSKFQRFSCKLSFLFPRHHPGELARRLIIFFIIVTITFIKSLL